MPHWVTSSENSEDVSIYSLQGVTFPNDSWTRPEPVTSPPDIRRVFAESHHPSGVAASRESLALLPRVFKAGNSFGWEDFHRTVSYRIAVNPMKRWNAIFNRRVTRIPSVLLLLCFCMAGCALFEEDRPAASARDESRMYPDLWSAEQRLFPHGRADKDVYREALKTVSNLRAAGKVRREALWEFAGPANIGGRVVDIEIDPNMSNVAYAASATGGVWRSDDRGMTWDPVFEDIAVMTIGDIAVDPNNPGVVYVGTGEANGGHNNFAGGGVFKSTDSGQSWRYLGLEETVTIGRVIIDPDDSRRVFVAATGSYFAPHPERGIYLSEDAGASWQKVLAVSDDCGGIDLAFKPDDSQVVYAAMWQRVRTYNQSALGGANSALYRSTDGGGTWQRLGAENGLPDGRLGERVGRIGLAVSPAVPETVWALYNDGREVIGLFRSDDQGNSWNRLDPENRIQAGTGGFSWFFGQVRVHPLHPDTLWVLDVALMRSPDGGMTWEIQHGSEPGLHVDHHAMAFGIKDPSFVLDGHDGGISYSADAGVSWREIEVLPVTQFYEIAVDPHRTGALYGGTQDNGTVRTRTGALDDWEEIFGGDGFYVIIDPEDKSTIYVESQFGSLARSDDGGETFSGIRPDLPERRTNWSTPVVLDPTDSTTLYYGADRLFKSTDQGRTWRAVSPVLTAGYVDSPRLGTITTIDVARTNPSVIMVGTDDGNVWFTSDGGENWRQVSDTLPFRWVTRVAIDPTDASRAFVAFSGLKWRDPQPHIFRTGDRGLTWQNISSGLPDAPINGLAIDAKRSNWIYVGTDVGAFVSNDFGDTWSVLGDNLPAVSVYDLKIDSKEERLVAGTHGRSMYHMDLEPLYRSIPEPDFSFRVFPPYPNPFSSSTTVSFVVPEAGQVRIDILDASGRTVSTLLDGSVSLGAHSIRWQGKDRSGAYVASGVYFLRLIRPGEPPITNPLVLVR